MLLGNEWSEHPNFRSTEEGSYDKSGSDKSFIILNEREHFFKIIHKGKTRVLPSALLVKMITESMRSERGTGFVALLGFDVEKYGIRNRDIFQYILFQHFSSSIFNRIGQSKAPFTSKIPLYKYNHYTVKDEITKEGQIKVEPRGLRKVVHDLHFDPNVLLFARGYGPIKNSSGGDLIITRVHDYCKDHEISLLEILDYFSVHGQLFSTVKEEHLSTLLHKYSSVIQTSKDNPIVFIDNRISIGVMHGSTPIGVLNQNESLHRYFFYTSIKQR